MRSHLRTVIVLAVAAALLLVFLWNVDLRTVAVELGDARPAWILVAIGTTLANLAFRAVRWQYLLEPLGGAAFGAAFRATAVGFAASAVLPARAGELIRPYFLARQERISATGAFATIVLERVLDAVTVLVLLAAFVLLFGDRVSGANPGLFRALTWAGGLACVLAAAALAALFVVASHPARLGLLLARLERTLPSAFAGAVARVAEKFAIGLGVVRRPGRLAVALVWSFPLWLSIAFGIYAVSLAFGLGIPFTGSFLLIALLVIGVAVPTPGAIGGFHEAFRLGATAFYGVPNEAAVAAALVLHAVSIGPSLLLGLGFAAQEGLGLTSVRGLAAPASTEPTT
jgi:uncharacterized protein (TIRG00374 family)